MFANNIVNDPVKASIKGLFSGQVHFCIFDLYLYAILWKWVKLYNKVDRYYFVLLLSQLKFSF